jgi:hypothetical protein
LSCKNISYVNVNLNDFKPDIKPLNNDYFESSSTKSAVSKTDNIEILEYKLKVI